MSTILFAVRHGETEWYVAGKQQGHLNSPLTDRGIKQAHCLAEGLSKKNIDVIFSSDLGRALQTAEIIAKSLRLEIHQEPQLRERHLGLMQGLTKNEFAQKFPQEAAQFDSGNPDTILPGGESVRQRFNRSVECAENLAQHNSGKRVLLIAHGGVLNSFFYKALNLPLTEPRRFSLFNAAISSFTITTTQWRLDSWGETTHLKNLKALDDN